MRRPFAGRESPGPRGSRRRPWPGAWPGVWLAAWLLVWLAVLPPSAAAFPLSGGCTLKVTSTDSKGATLDTASSGDQSASASDPLLVDWEGTVSWTASSTVALQNNRWQVTMYGLPTPLRGSSPNSGDSRASGGTFAFKANAPFRFTGLYYIAGGISGSGGACDGSLVVKLVGDPLATVPFVVSLGLLVIGALLLLWGYGGHLAAALFGGLIGGLGLALFLVVLSLLVVGGSTPLVAVGIGLAAGLSAALGGRVRAGRLASASAPPVMAPVEAVEPEPAAGPDGAAEPGSAAEPVPAAGPVEPVPAAEPVDAGAAAGAAAPVEPASSREAPEPPAPGAATAGEPPATT